MNLPEHILGSLVATTVTREYCLSYPLKYTATKFTESLPRAPSARSTQVCLLIGVAVGCSSELWLPVIKRLYLFQHSPGSSIHISSIWVIDRPNHGDAASLNRDTLLEHYSTSFPSIEYGAAMNEFRHSGLLSCTELANLVAIGHSGGGAAIIHAVPPGFMLPYRLFVLIDGPFMDRTDATDVSLRTLEARFSVINRNMANEWASAQEAVNYLKRFPPWNRFDKENLEIMALTFFRPSSEGSNVAMKLDVEQRIASFTDSESALSGGERLVEMLHAPNAPAIHFMLATDQDLWTPPMAAAIRKKVVGLRGQGLGLTEVEAGHHAPHEKPELSAIAIMHILTDRLGKPGARL